MNYAETTEYLYRALPVFHRTGGAAYKANLDNSIAFDKHLNCPHRRYKTVHVAGTNGKGSTSHIIAAVLQEAGYRTGLYTSPHLCDFRERIKVNGAEIDEASVVAFVEKNHDIIDTLRPSFFEMSSAMAFDFFTDAGVDVAVIETGMGGRLDSTNIISPELSLITNIALDHTQFLGDSIDKIAKEKAGIMKFRRPTLIGERHVESSPVFEAAAAALEAPLHYAEDMLRVIDMEVNPQGRRFRIQSIEGKIFDEIEFCVSLDLLGGYQAKNMVSAIGALELLRSKGFDINLAQLQKGCESAAHSTGLKGRWQIMRQSPMMIFDTGHNAHGLSEVAAQLKRLKCDKLYMVFGVVNDKDVDSIFHLLPREAYYLFTQASIPRAMDASLLAEKGRSAGLVGEVHHNVEQALVAARNMASIDDVIFVGGSTFVVADAISMCKLHNI
ncbi:MAG: bifunctional folylpolyglutamate synthase/dihydrofolate synthase [Prevotellaceae bacterium]|jgi:dihydrofolate synthase/folylpolyglutamate synthase|nr:bifunctional folylpolyglutamate synthase/dihydrofolate synthase [Prevotellaceae bacterium]